MQKPLFSTKIDWAMGGVVIFFVLLFAAFYSTAQQYEIIKDFITAVLTVAGLVIAAMGLATWKKQIRGIKEFDSAYNLHYSLLKVRDAIKHVRNPAIWPSESYQAKQYAKEKYPEQSEEDLEKNSHPTVYEMRWKKITSATTEMESHLLALEVLWGKEILRLIKPLDAKITELNIGLRQYFQPELRTGDYMELHKIIYGRLGDSEDDVFSKDIERIIDTVANYLKEKIS